MKKSYLILLVLVVNSVICFGTEQIELTSRLGESISLDSRNYFGLFPDVKDYKSAVLYKNVGHNYFEISAGKSEVKSKIILSDSAVATLAYVIDNYEGIISEPTNYKLNGKLISGLLRVSTQFNKKAKSVNITLRDSTKFSGFILYADSSNLVTTPDSTYRPKSGNLRITGYYDIYSITNVDYPIIDGTQTLFVINNTSFKKMAIFKNVAGISVTPPEVLKCISANPIPEVKEAYKSSLDFDKLYFKRMMVAVDYTYQLLYKNKYDFIVGNDIPILNLYLTHYCSLGLNCNYKISRRMSTEIGYKYELISYKMGNNVYNALYSNSFNINFGYTIWHSRKNQFEYNQLFSELIGGVSIHNYRNKSDKTQYVNTLYSKYLTGNSKLSYMIGTRMRYKINKTANLLISGFINYYDRWGKLRLYNMSSENIPYNISYGLSAGLGFDL
ncbi:MAG: hypothetical protein WCR42_02880 [bacterium]